MTDKQGGIPDLASIRGNRGVSLRQIADSTRIGMQYLQAIEAAEIEKLPAGIYRASYIRQYAKAIQYDDEALLESYRSSGQLPRPRTEEVTPPGFFKRLIRSITPLVHGGDLHLRCRALPVWAHLHFSRSGRG